MPVIPENIINLQTEIPENIINLQTDSIPQTIINIDIEDSGAIFAEIALAQANNAKESANTALGYANDASAARDAAEKLIPGVGSVGDYLQKTADGTQWASFTNTWGEITGDIQSQTDLQSALDAKQDVLDEYIKKGTHGTNFDSGYGYAALVTKSDSRWQIYRSYVSLDATDADRSHLLSRGAVSTELSALQNTLNAKQDTLTAGDNITIENNVISASASGGGTWGSITGTLSNQTDLQGALDEKLNEPTTAGTQGQVLAMTSPSEYGWTTLKDADVTYTNVRSETKTLDYVIDSLYFGSRYQIPSDGWVRGTVINNVTYYTYILTLEKTLNTPSPVIGLQANSERTLPTEDERRAYNTFDFAFADTNNNRIIFYSRRRPSSTFYVTILGVL